MKRIMLSCLGILLFWGVSAQEDQDEGIKALKKDFENYRENAIRDFNNYRDKENANFAEFMRKEWEYFQEFKGIPKPKSPDPVTPPVIDPTVKPVDNPVPHGKVEPIPEKPKQAQPIEPIPVEPQDNQQCLKFKFYNVDCKVAWSDNLRFHLSAVREDSLAVVWERLAGKDYNEFIADCIQLRSKLVLCDWAYIELLQQITSEIFSSSKTNEAVFLQYFVMCQTGYKVRIALCDETNLALLFATDFTLYNRNYVNISNEKFYLIDVDAQKYRVFDHGFPHEQALSLRIEAEPKFRDSGTNAKTFFSKQFPAATAKTSANKELIDFYNSYPYCDWKVYASTPLSEQIRKDLYPVLEYAIKGKTQAEAANILINFVQTAFEYKTDQEQFGYERPFFPDEVFYYPYSDCEDRAILFSTLVRDLLKLKVVLLHYPAHLATAVHFNDEVVGDYLQIDDEKYLVCDPTYIGAPIGEAMPQFKNTSADVVTLK